MEYQKIINLLEQINHLMYQINHLNLEQKLWVETNDE